MAKEILKKWYESKTLWLNLIMALGIGTQILTQADLPLDPEWQAFLLAVINAVLRLVTEKRIAKSLI